MITFEDIEQIICYGERVSAEALSCKNRKREIVQARQMIFYFARRYTNASLQKIGDRYKKDHALAYHSCTVIENFIETEQRFRDKIKDYENQIIALNDIEKEQVSEKLKEIVNQLKIALITGKPINFEAAYIYNKLIKKELI